MKPLLVFIFTLYTITSQKILFAQAPVVQWAKSYGGSSSEDAKSIKPTADGGYIVAGSTSSTQGNVTGNHGSNDFWVTKLSATGTLTWQKCYGGSGSDIAYEVRQTTDGGYIVAGYTNSVDGDVTGLHLSTLSGTTPSDFWIVKISSTGTLQWQKTFGGSRNERAYSIVQTSDGGYVVTGDVASNDGDVTSGGYHVSGVTNLYNQDVWVVKINSIGAIQWQKCYGSSGIDVANAIVQTTDGGYFVSGYVQTTNNGDVQGVHGSSPDCWAVKLDALGTLVWQKCLGGTQYEGAYAGIQTADGGYIVVTCGHSGDGDVIGNVAGDEDWWIAKLSSTGAIQWAKCYGGATGEQPKAIRQTADGGYVVAGYTQSNNGDVSGNHGILDFWVLKLDGSGLIEWQKCLGGSLSELAYSIELTSDGGYIVAGYSQSVNGDVNVNQGSTDFWVVKLVFNSCTPLIHVTASAARLCVGLPITFTANVTNSGTNPIYQWKVNGVNAGGNTSSFTTSTLNDNDTIVCAFTSSVTCLSNPASVSDTFVIRLSSKVQPSVAISTISGSICQGSPATFIATPQNSGTTPVYQWTKNGASVGFDANSYTATTINNGDIIKCVMTSNAICAIPASTESNLITMVVNPLLTPATVITVLADTICTGALARFTAIPTNGGTAPTYQWIKNGNIVGTNASVFTDNTITEGDIIICKITSNATCISTPFATSNAIQMHIQKHIPVNIGVDKSICEGTSIVIQAQAGYASYNWQNNSQNAVFTATQAGSYFVKVKDNCGNESSDTVIISLFPRITHFLPADTALCSYESLVIKPNQSFTNYIWSNNTTASSITVNTSGQYWLTAKDNNGCSSNDTITIKAKDCIKGFYMPSAFTPNGDAKNDVLKPLVFGKVSQYQFTILNRWGNVIFKTSDIGKGWDGKLNGKPLDTNAFIWMCTYQFENESIQSRKGTVTLIR